MNAVVDALIEVSLYAVIITGCILLFRALFHKAISARLQYLLWGALILRLLVPVTFESGFHVSEFLPERPVTVESVQTAPETGYLNPSEDVAPGLQAGTAADGAAAEAPAQTPSAPRVQLPWRTIAFWVWLAGVIVSLAATLTVRIRFYRRLRQSTVPESATVRLMLAGCAEAVGLSCPIWLLTTRLPLSPALALLFGRNILILPDRLTDKRQLRYALLHELTHLKRGDALVLVLLCLLRCVYWFNPVLYFAFSELRADMETACDAEVLALIEPSEKRDYLTTLLRLFSAQSQPSLGFAQVQTKRLAAKRMKGAFMKPKSTLPSCVMALLLALMLGVTCFTTACQKPVAATPGSAVASPGDAVASPGNAAVLVNSALTALPETPVISGTTVTVPLSDGRQITFEVSDQGANEHSATASPRGETVSPMQAAATAAEFMLRAFGDHIEPCTLYVYFANYEDIAMEQYQITFGEAEFYDAAEFSATVNASTGEMISANWERQVGEPIANPGDWSWDDYDSSETMVKELYSAATAYIGARFPSDYSNSIGPDSYIDGVQATFVTVDPICADAYLHMGNGPCYSLRIQYPSMTVTNVTCYALGWEYCVNGTVCPEYMEPSTDPEELAEDEQYVAPVPTPTPPTPSDLGAQIPDETYLLIAQTAEVMIGDEFSPADFGLSENATFYELCARWTEYVTFDTLKLSVGAQETVLCSSLDDPVLKRGMRIGFRFGDYDYAGIYIGDGFAIALAKSTPHRVRLISLTDIESGGQLSNLTATLFYQGA